MTVSSLAPAKLNLFLHILDKRNDGYHNLLSALQLLDWGDVVSLYLTKDDTQIKVHGEHSHKVPQGKQKKHNLAYRALELMRKECRPPKDIRNANINIKKNIPVGAGLGGGSSDAAAVLRILRLLWKPQMPVDELAQLGEQLGADIPFFVKGFSSFAKGIGEHLIRFNIPSRYYLVIYPYIHSSTAELFALLDKQRVEQCYNIGLDKVNNLISSSDYAFSFPQGTKKVQGKDFWHSFLSIYTKLPTNDFIQPLIQKFPQLQDFYKIVDKLTPNKIANKVFLSGSGSSVFIVYESKAMALKSKKILEKEIDAYCILNKHKNSFGSISSYKLYLCRGVYCSTDIELNTQ